MKKSFYLFLMIFFISTGSTTYAEQATSKLNVKGMFCEGCSSKVEDVLSTTPGVQSATVDYNKSVATIQYDSSKTTPDELAEVITDTGFESTVAR